MNKEKAKRNEGKEEQGETEDCEQCVKVGNFSNVDSRLRIYRQVEINQSFCMTSRIHALVLRFDHAARSNTAVRYFLVKRTS